MKLLSELPVASLLVYPTQGKTSASQQACNFIRHTVKSDGFLPDGREAIPAAVKRLADLLPGSALEEFLADLGTLVPVPRSFPLQKDSLWPGASIAAALSSVGLGDGPEILLERVEPVSSSHLAVSGERLDPEEHVQTIRLRPGLLAGPRVTLIDDVVARGATLLACATLVKNALPGADVRAFALARVELDADLVALSDMVQPSLQQIERYASGKLWRK